MPQPYFSVITINKNNLIGLIKTFESVQKQTCRDFEFIVIDGISNDGSVEFLREKEVYISKLKIETDKGIYDAQNKGILLSEGEFLIFLNSGDVFSTENVLENVKTLNSHADLIYGDVTVLNQNHSTLIQYPNAINLKFWIDNVICHQAVFFRRTLFQILGLYDLNYKFCSDQKFLITVWVNEKLKKDYFSASIADYDETGVSSNIKNRRKIIFELFKIRFLLLPWELKVMLLFLSAKLKVKQIVRNIFFKL
ncbi:glycosyltransferase [Leptospira sp. 85282-16]|uniref:glycosyltransferase family 2 protein n=1 Tax=Leptospira sp. 85282-16 TaxID=2971256 RepID=UPI0021C0366E|nr:glycosyltransferase family 2 protein [Leptospira sp. 85282-16]MCT8332223.1 glycosyltransferase [Leptospira sp. 85282-16]